MKHVRPVPSPVRRYRYRTVTLLGPWRESRMQAAADAVAAGQAEWSTGDRLVWKVDGEIEMGEGSDGEAQA